MEFRGLRKTIILSFLTFCCLVHHLCGDIEKTNNATNPIIVEDQVHVGVILDMGSREGKIIHSCISVALSDFYYLHNNYSTRVVLYNKDSKGKPLPALSAALDFFENIKVEAIIGAQTSVEANLLAELGEVAKLPIMSLSAPLTDNKYPFFIEIMRADEVAEVKGISALIEVFKWRDVVLLYENKEYERDFIPSWVNSFQEITHASVACKSFNIASSSSNEEIIEDLQMLMKLKIKVFVVHVSHFLAPRLFLSANKLGMMSEGYAWIMTSTSMNFLHSMDLSVIESMQGVLGFRSSIPASMSLHSLTSRLRRKFYQEDPNMEAIWELSVDEICTYDATWALAEAVERARLKNSTTRSSKGVVLLGEILQSRFKGLSGEIQYLNGKLISSETFEIVNVIGKGEIKRIGLWPCKEGEKTRKESPQQQLLHNRRKFASTIDLERIIWPGGSKRELSTNETLKLRIGVPVRLGFKELVCVDHNLETNTTHVTGFSIEVFKAAVEALPYEVQYEFIPYEDGNGNPAGTYNDLVYQVYLKKFDAVVGDITITWNRSQYVDFTVPYTELGVGMLVPKNDKGNMWIFFKPLSRNLWITTAAFFILTGIVVWVVEHPTNTEFQGTPGKQIGTVLWFSFSTLVFAYTEKLSTNLARFVVIIWVFVVLILTSTYTANLSSMMTVKQIELNSRGNNIGYQSGSLGVIVNLNFKGAKPYRSAEEYFHALSKGSKHGGVSGIIDEVPYIKIFLAKYSADYAMINPQSITNGFAFVFPKGSKLVHDVSRQIEFLRQEKKLIEMEKAWFHEKTTLMYDEDISKGNPNTIELYDFRGLFLISGASLAIALFLFVVLSLRFRNLIRGLMQRLRIFLSVGNTHMPPVPMQLVVQLSINP
ncbi:hypothetical protein M0R45_035322 [Rubus argutus]|uniref:Glutamate receptor n=1 Tax=Rubus argutus TaxID=59490 RepID=A0AAW1VY60_RUBAR